MQIVVRTSYDPKDETLARRAMELAGKPNVELIEATAGEISVHVDPTLPWMTSEKDY